MTFIQIILLVLVLVILWRLYQRLAAGELTRREFVEWFLLWLAAGYLVIVPETSSWLFGNCSGNFLVFSNSRRSGARQ